jgi:hypothetical protein
MGLIKPDDIYRVFSPEDLNEIAQTNIEELTVKHPQWSFHFVHAAKLLDPIDLATSPQIVFDECLSPNDIEPVGKLLKPQFLCVGRSELRGTQDPQLLNWMINKKVRLFVTADKEFALNVRKKQLQHPLSLVFIRPTTRLKLSQVFKGQPAKIAKTLNDAATSKTAQDLEI